MCYKCALLNLFKPFSGFWNLAPSVGQKNIQTNKRYQINMEIDLICKAEELANNFEFPVCLKHK